ncbi:MAG: MASE1 domain-containing protein [Promethearchaeota archaeon]
MEHSRTKSIWFQIILNCLITGIIAILGIMSQYLATNYENIVLPLYIPAGFSYYFLYKKSKFNAIGVFLGTFVEAYINLGIFPVPFPGSLVITSILISVANTVQPLFACLMIEKYCQNHDFLYDIRSLSLFFLSTIIFCLCAGVIGSFALILGNYVDISFLFPTIFSWTVSDVAAIILISPVLIELKSFRLEPNTFGRKVEFLAFLVCTSLFQLLVLIYPANEFNFDYFVIILITWTVFRFSKQFSLIHVFSISISIIAGLYTGKSHFLQSDFGYSLLMVQLYLFVIAFTNLLMICLITERKRYSQDLEEEVEQALSKIKILTGFLPICSSCKKIRDEDGDWHRLENYIDRHSEAKFTHGYCPECMENTLKELDEA